MNMNRNVEEDLELLADAFFENLEISNVEYGGIGLDPKRPFGNSDARGDILEIIGMEPTELGKMYNEYSKAQLEYADDLYFEKLIPFLRERWMELNS